MTRSRMRKLQREMAKRKRNFAAYGPLAAAMALATPARSQETAAEPAPQSAPASGTGGVEEIVVTSQKRAENMQDVPVSITAFGTQQLEDLRVEDFDDYAKFLPSLTYTTGGPGFSRVFFRGVSSGDNGNHSGSQPTVGMYLDEQPITTIQGALDVHLYDIERVEALAGPQGTLYGASSQAGTIRIITNKPQLGEFAASYDVEGNVDRRRAGLRRGGHAERAARRESRDPASRLEQARGRLHRQRVRDAQLRDGERDQRIARHDRQRGVRRERLQRRRHLRRACGPARRPERQLDDHAHSDGPAHEGSTAASATTRASAGAIPRASTRRRAATGGCKLR